MPPAPGRRFFEAASVGELTEVYRNIGASVTTVEERQDLTAPLLGVAFASPSWPPPSPWPGSLACHDGRSLKRTGLRRPPTAGP